MTNIPNVGIRVIVCGGRNFDNQQWMDKVLDHLHSEHVITALIQGGQATRRDGRIFGADWQAAAWAIKRKVYCRTYYARWRNEDGSINRAAGPQRNAWMLKDANPNLVVAFPGGRGTANMVDLANRAGVIVWRPRAMTETLNNMAEELQK